MKKTKTIFTAAILIVLVVLIITLILDNQIIAAIQNTSSLDSFFSFFEFFMFFEKSFIFYPAVFLISLLLLKKRGKKGILPFVISFAISLILCYLLKIAIARPRPFEGLGSFPSGHATALFVPLLFIKRRYMWIWLIISCLLLAARLWTGLHYLSDLIAGATLGYYIAFTIIFIFKKKKLV